MIVRLEVENVKRLRAVSMMPPAGLVLVAGNNTEGKTSLLDAIEMAFAGKRADPPEVIHRGQDHAHVVVETDDLVVKRRWWREEDPETGQSVVKTALLVTDREGVKKATPQALLDSMYSQLTFDPLGFMRMKGKEQVEVLKKLLNLDFTELEKEAAQVYAERTVANRRVSDLEAQIKALPPIPDGVGTEEVPLTTLLSRQRVALQEKAANDAKRKEAQEGARRRTAAEARVASANDRISALERQLKDARLDLVEAERALAAAEDEQTYLDSECAGLKDPDVAAVEAEIEATQKKNEVIRLHAKRRAKEAELDAAGKEAARLDNRYNELLEDKARQIREAPMPLPGLGFTEDGVTLNGLSLAQASGAQRLQLSVAMGLRLNPKLKVLLIRDGSLLDDQRMEDVERYAREVHPEAQVLMEVVGHRKGAEVLIEDGTGSGPAVDAAVEAMRQEGR
jgi:DNA repair exonuclease SbcCD ATPase subunit